MQLLKLELDCAGDKKALAKSKTVGETKSPYDAETEQEIREFIAQYYGMITNVDHNVGRILNVLDRNGITDNTIVVFMSDHGDMFGQHGHFCGIKRAPFRGSMQVPFIVRYPERFKAGKTVSSLIDVAVDSMPTLLDICGIEVPDEVQGNSYLPLLEGTSETTRDAVMYEIMKQTKGGSGDYVPVPERGIRTQKWLYVRKPDRPKFLFDLEKDPDEMNNLINNEKYKTVMEEFDKVIEKHMKETGDDWDLEADFPPPDFLTHEDADVYLEKEVLQKAIVKP
jgi:arylsulfatase A-like enzyme